MMFSHRTAYFFGNAANLWHIFIFAGVFALTAPYLITLEVSLTRTIVVGCVSILIGVALKLNHFGVQIDLKNHQYRDYVAVFGFKRGNWHQFSDLKKVVLTSKNVSSWNTPNGVSPTFKTNIINYTIALFGDSEQPILFFQTENEKEAKVKAELLAEKLQLSLDAFV